MSDMTEAPSRIAMEAAQADPIQTGNFDLLAGISMRMSVEAGSASLTLSEILQLSEGSVIELDRQANDLLDILVNGTLIAKGEIVEVNGRYGIRVADVVAPDRRLAGMERRS
jgi:flagellar motor switch protein FliN